MYSQDSTAFTFKGHVTIDLKCIEPADEIVLHVNSLNVSISKT